MSSTVPSQRSFTDAVVSATRSSQSIPLSLEPVSSTTMKDVSNLSTRATRPSAYPKKRPSPHGISKSRKHASSPLFPAQDVVRRSPRAAKADLLVQRQREAQILAMRREGIYLEEEYRDEIKFYMHEMEVSTAAYLSRARNVSLKLRASASVSQCARCNPWISSPKSGGTCVHA